MCACVFCNFYLGVPEIIDGYYIVQSRFDEGFKCNSQLKNYDHTTGSLVTCPSGVVPT